MPTNPIERELVAIYATGWQGKEIWMTSKLLRISPASVEASVEVLNDIDFDIYERQVLGPISIEPCGRYAWVTTECGADMEAIESSISDGIECGALPVPEIWC